MLIVAPLRAIHFRCFGCHVIWSHFYNVQQPHPRCQPLNTIRRTHNDLDARRATRSRKHQAIVGAGWLHIAASPLRPAPADMLTDPRCSRRHHVYQISPAVQLSRRGNGYVHEGKTRRGTVLAELCYTAQLFTSTLLMRLQRHCDGSMHLFAGQFRQRSPSPQAILL